jgi:hypothetical protein
MKNVSAKDFMERWLLQKNYPIVDVVLQRSGSANSVRFVQNRFLNTLIDEEEPGTEPSPFK